MERTTCSNKLLRAASVLMAVVLLLLGAGCSLTGTASVQPMMSAAAITEPHGEIYLYGEVHSSSALLQKELALWSGYYHEQGMRNLFVELPYYEAQMLNLWMQAEDDALLDQLFEETAGTAGSTELVKGFYRSIKQNEPDTVFHGTDVGHQYWSSGQRYLELLRSENKQDTAEYRRTVEVMEQGAVFYTGQSADLTERYLLTAKETAEDWSYRENKMVENFLWAYEQLEDPRVMGIYGAVHTDPEGIAYQTPDLPCMGNQLMQYYGAAVVHAVDLTNEPLASQLLLVNGKTYDASFFGTQDLSAVLPQYRSRSFWRLENAYGDFQNAPVLDDFLPYNNYPMQVQTGQVFALLYVLADGSEQWMYYRSDGKTWNGLPVTQQFRAE